MNDARINTPADGAAATAAAPSAGRPLKSLLAAGLTILATLVLAYLYRHYSLRFLFIADNANDLIEGDAILHGNILLHNWVLTTVSFYTTDVLFQAIGVAIRGFDPVLIYEVPVASFMVTLGIAIWLAGHRYVGRACLLAGGVTFVLMGLPCPLSAFNNLLGPFHGGTMLYILLAFAALDGSNARDTRVSPWRMALYILALTMATIADTMTLYVAIAPILLVCGLRVKADRTRRANELPIMLGAVAAYILSKVFLVIVAHLGGFRFDPASAATAPVFVAFDKLPQNISWTIEGLLKVVDADFFGRPIRPSTLISILNLIPLVVLFSAGTKTLRRIVHADRELDRISAVLTVGMAVTLVSYTLSTLPIGLLTTRYFVPFLFMGAVLAGRLAGQSFPKEHRLYIALAVAALIGTGYLVRQMREPEPEPPARVLAAWLEAHHLENGYGGYWCCADTTIYSRNKVHVRPIIGAFGKVKAFLWAVDRSWYSAPANFVVIRTIPDTDKVNEESLALTFGPYATRYTVSDYTVFVYSHDISPRLPRLPQF